MVWNSWLTFLTKTEVKLYAKSWHFKRKTCLGINRFVFRLVLVFKKDRKADQLRSQAGRAQGAGFYTSAAPPSVRDTSIGAKCWMVASMSRPVDSEVRELEAPQTCVQGFCPVLSPYPGLLSLGCCPWAQDKRTWLLFFPVLNSTFLFGLIKIVRRWFLVISKNYPKYLWWCWSS